MKLSISGATLLSLGIIGIIWVNTTMNSADDSKALQTTPLSGQESPPDSSASPSAPAVETLAIPEPSAHVSAGEERPLLDAVAIREAVAETTLKYAYLPFPSAAAEASHVDRLASIPFEGQSLWEDGIQDMIVLQSWRCVWLEHAGTSFEKNDLEEVRRSGMLIEQLRNFPAIQEHSPGFESYIQHQIQPLINGDGAGAPRAFGSECRNW